jgi:hypothetical protein
VFTTRERSIKAIGCEHPFHPWNMEIASHRSLRVVGDDGCEKNEIETRLSLATIRSCVIVSAILRVALSSRSAIRWSLCRCLGCSIGSFCSGLDADGPLRASDECYMYVLIIVEYINQGIDLCCGCEKIFLVETAKRAPSLSSHHGMDLRRKW